ncbi:MAG: SPOR domain-containing protein [Polyangia bacterium]|jgi:cell division septation protein DedD|nr:SPOR domain-containing protein [Polyangia bacterium]
MRDADRLKEKLEVSLDNRQIFFLFFGSAVIACLVFVLGVMVGKRLEARKARTARPASDELARVDRDSKIAAPKLTFHDELVKPDARSLKDVPPEVLEWQSMGKKDPGGADVVAVGGAQPSPEPSEPGVAEGAGTRPEPAKPAKPARRYTLQVSAYQNKGEADQMVKKLQQAGYRPYVVSASVPNRGVWFRVRVGSFGSLEQAVEAKGKFEEKLNLAAYVSRR